MHHGAQFMNAPGIVGHAGVFPFPGIERSSPDFAAASVFASDFSISASTELQKPHWRQLHCRQWSSDWASLHHWSHFAVCFVSSRHVAGSRSGSGCPPGSGALQNEHAAQSQLAQCCKLNLMEHQTVHLGTISDRECVEENKHGSWRCAHGHNKLTIANA